MLVFFEYTLVFFKYMLVFLFNVLLHESDRQFAYACMTISFPTQQKQLCNEWGNDAC